MGSKGAEKKRKIEEEPSISGAVDAASEDISLSLFYWFSPLLRASALEFLLAA